MNELVSFDPDDKSIRIVVQPPLERMTLAQAREIMQRAQQVNPETIVGSDLVKEKFLGFDEALAVIVTDILVNPKEPFEKTDRIGTNFFRTEGMKEHTLYKVTVTYPFDTSMNFLGEHPQTTSQKPTTEVLVNFMQHTTPNRILVSSDIALGDTFTGKLLEWFGYNNVQSFSFALDLSPEIFSHPEEFKFRITIEESLNTKSRKLVFDETPAKQERIDFPTLAKGIIKCAKILTDLTLPSPIQTSPQISSGSTMLIK